MKAMLFPCLCPLRSADHVGIAPHEQHGHKHGTITEFLA